MDEQAWKRLRPVLATSLVPLVAVGGLFAVATYAKHSANPADRPTMAAFDACLTNNGLQPQQSYASQFDAEVAAQQEWKTCGKLVPQAVLRKWQAPAQAAQESFRECLQNMGAFGSRGYGRFGDHSAFRNAYETCRSLMRQGPAPAKSPAKPVAPVA
ncbi:MAG: hypothetical protein JO064_05065 [Actinobacteria bacterium]|nr:hypothetical protein [Actinomycetota bacterium]